MRQCKKCLTDKAVSLFYQNKARKDGYDHYCKGCRRQVSRNRDPEYVRSRKQSNLQEWRCFFLMHYGSHPSCEVCGRALVWFDGTKNNVVHWDHRHGNNECKQPYDWCASRKCTDDHRRTWLDFDFGILCHSCNKCLPTADREEWIRNVNRYVFGDKKVIMHASRTDLADGLDWEY